jgi:uncharacterized tellurite resistance protein B-like protein
MFDRLKSLLSGDTLPAPADRDVKTAVAALLVEAAWSSDGFQAEERRVITRLLQDRFQLAPADAERLVDAGDTAGRATTHMLRFTKRVLEELPPEDRGEIVEMLWDVVFADGRLDPDRQTAGDGAGRAGLGGCER